MEAQTTGLKIKAAFIKASRSLWNALPLVLGTTALVSILTAVLPKSFYLKLFNRYSVLDSLIGALLGSISAGSPITSYIIGGELSKQGVSFIAITSFLVAWVTVGIIQLPAESAILGKKFALLRNFSAFILSILVAVATILLLKII